MRRIALESERGFTLVEVTVAMAVLLVGVVGALSMLDFANRTTVTTKAREQGVALQREIVEAARGMPYDQLTPSGVVANVQAAPNLGDDQSTAPGWQVRRRGLTYTVSVGACSIDDPGDGRGAVDDAQFCPTGNGSTAQECKSLLGSEGAIQGTAAAAQSGVPTAAKVGNCGIDLNLDGRADWLTRAELTSGAGVSVCGLGPLACQTSPTVDRTPDDYKRVVTLVRWDRGDGSRYALQSTTVPNPGSAAAPHVTALTAAGSLSVTAATSVVFTATTSRQPASVSWLVDGNLKGTATGAGTAWTFTWDLGAVGGSEPNDGQVLDGGYVVGARAADAYGTYGQTKALTVSVNRRAPYGPAGFAAGGNTGGSGGSGVVEFEWNANRERDIVGYRVIRSAPGGDVQVCPSTAGATTRATSCQATGQPTGPLDSPAYHVVAVDRDTGGGLRAGDASSTVTVTAGNVRPFAPGTLTASSSGGRTVLTWAASAGDPDAGDEVAFYRIYRDGTAMTVADRYDRTGTGAEVSFTDTNTGGNAHTYRVVAVDTRLAESTFSNAVTS